MSAKEEPFVPSLFMTLTYSGKRWCWDDLAIDTRGYLVWLSRKLGAHLRAVIGIELGANTHVHMVIYSPDLDVNAKTIDVAGSRRAWPFGNVTDIQPYDTDKGQAGIFYTAKHTIIPMAGEVFCHGKGKCRRGGCVHPNRLERLR